MTSGKIEQGGSTITQQLVKNRLLTSKRDVNRKIREIVLALRLNDKYSKREILEQYLNTVYFGQGSYGVKAAVERFFLTTDPGGPRSDRPLEDHRRRGRAARRVDLEPRGQQPVRASRSRQSAPVVRAASHGDEGYITQAQVAAGEAEPLPTIKPPADLRPQNAWAEEVQDRLFNDPLYAVLGKTVRSARTRCSRAG